jgi:hypothetical protein
MAKRKLIAFEQDERLALKIVELLNSLSYSQASQVLIVADRLLKENAIFEEVTSDT